MIKEIETANLEEVLNYTNKDILARFQEKYDIEIAEVEIIFEETKKWLWLCNEGLKPENNFNFVIDDSLIIIDEMWHNFILFTKDYHDFCLINFGKYLHHQPTTVQDRNDWNKDYAKSIESYKEILKIQYSYVYDNLGLETLNKWYVYFAEKYTKENLKIITK
jgi:hypothetical protein